MKFFSTAGHLLAGLKCVTGAIRKTVTQPILANVRLDLQGGQLEFYAADLELASRALIAVNGITSGTTTVAGHKLEQILASLPPNEDVHFAMGPEGTQMRVTCGQSVYRLNALPADGFPVLNLADGIRFSFKTAAAALAEAIQPVTPAMASNDIRFYLNGLCLDFNQAGATRFVATDGHRMHLNASELEGVAPCAPAAPTGQVILPARSVALLARMLQSEGEAEVQVANNGLMSIKLGDQCLTTKLIDGTFPDFNRVLPKRTSLACEVRRDELESALDRIKVVASQCRSPGVTIKFEPNALRLSATAEGGDDGEEVIACKGESPAGKECLVMLPYLHDAVASCGSEKVEITQARPEAPVEIRPFGDKTGFRAIVMPMRATV